MTIVTHVFHPTTWVGPHDARVVFVGEAWGATEQQHETPFAGESGKLLWEMLGNAWPEVAPEAHAKATEMHRWGDSWLRERGAWLAAAGAAFTNVFNARPPGNKIEMFCGSRSDVGKDYALPHLSQGKYVLPQHLHHLQRLRAELEQCKPNLIVALGNTACWALLRATNIGSIRGTISASRGLLSQFKVLPTYHPAGVLRQWGWRPIVISDFIKALREAEFSEIRRPERKVLIDPTLNEVALWIADTLSPRPALLGCDIETQSGQITCISFARNRFDALVIPFVDSRKPNWSYWTHEEERQVWLLVKLLLEHGMDIVGQNFLYDLQYITRMGIRPKVCSEDTMLLHHSLFPEMQKGLGFLGSIYTSEASWKLLRKKSDTEKRDE